MENNKELLETKEDELTEEASVLFKELYDSVDCPCISDMDIIGFIEYCEDMYKMTTKEFLKWFRENGEEGNVDMQMWYSFAKNNEIME